jgi:hypothetical protein
MGKTDDGFAVLVNVAPGQSSETVGAVQLTVASHAAFAFIVMLDGHPVITGLVLSTTVTLNEHVEVLLAASLAV